MNNRQSRFELLRVVAILFVVAHHVLLFGADLCGYLTPWHSDGPHIIGVILNSVVVTGVSLFVMISGWFGIQRVLRPMVRLVIECAVFGAFSLGLCLLLYNILPIEKADGHWSLIRLYESMKFTNWWFIVHYLLLILCAPLLERFLQGISQREHEKVLLCLLVLNCVFGFWWGYVNESGYNVIQFIFLYVIARYMRLFPSSIINKVVSRGAWWYIAFCVVMMSSSVFTDKAAYAPGRLPEAWNYNCPLVILESMAIFSLFTRINRPVPCVNRIAPLVLGVYLIQSSPNLIWYRNLLGKTLTDQLGTAALPLAILLLFVICLALSAVITIPLNLFFRKIGIK